MFLHLSSIILERYKQSPPDMGSSLARHLPKSLSSCHNIIKELMTEALPKTDLEKVMAIQEVDEDFKDEKLTVEQQQILLKVRAKLVYSTSISIGGSTNTTKVEVSWLKIGLIGTIKLKRCLASDIQHLHLNGAYIGSKGCKIISQARWEKLETLELYQNQICQAGAKHLSKAPFKSLTFLHLGINFLKLQGFCYLLRCCWVNLQQLYIYNNEFTTEVFGLYSISQWNGLYNLHTEIYGLRDQQTEKAKMIIKNRFPKASTVCV